MRSGNTAPKRQEKPKQKSKPAGCFSFRINILGMLKKVKLVSRENKSGLKKKYLALTV